MTFLWSECECMSVWLSRFSILVFPIIPWGARWYSDLHSPRWVLVLFRTWLLLKSAELKTFPRGVLNRKCQNSTILSCIGASAQVYMFTLSEGHTVGNKTHLLWIIHFLFVLYVGLVGSDIMDCCVRLFGCKVIGSLSLRGGNWFFVNVIFAFGYMRFWCGWIKKFFWLTCFRNCSFGIEDCWTLFCCWLEEKWPRTKLQTVLLYALLLFKLRS